MINLSSGQRIMRLLILVSGVAIGALAMAAPAVAQSEKAAVRTFQQFDGVVEVETGGAKALTAMPGAEAPTVPKRVTVRQLIIDGGQRIDLGERGGLLVELKAGALTTVISGTRRERHEGEIWTVPVGATMTIETDDDAAIIETTTISDPQQ